MTPDEVAAEWKHAGLQRQFQLRRESEVVPCPLPGCLAPAGEPCSYDGPVIDNETGRNVGRQRVVRFAHLERLAVFTDGRLFGYTLAKLRPRSRRRLAGRDARPRPADPRSLPEEGTILMTTPPTPEPREKRGGRPRDPSRGPAIIDATVSLLALVGLDAVTADTIAAEAGVGKATIYRRWPAIDDLLGDAVATLGVRPGDVDLGPVVGGTGIRGDVYALVTGAITGQRAHAERAIMSALPYRPALQRGYARAQARLDEGITAVMTRAINRGDATAWPGAWRIKAAIALLHQACMAGRVPDVAMVLDDVVWGVR